MKVVKKLLMNEIYNFQYFVIHPGIEGNEILYFVRFLALTPRTSAASRATLCMHSSISLLYLRQKIHSGLVPWKILPGLPPPGPIQSGLLIEILWIEQTSHRPLCQSTNSVTAKERDDGRLIYLCLRVPR